MSSLYSDDITEFIDQQMDKMTYLYSPNHIVCSAVLIVNNDRSGVNRFILCLFHTPIYDRRMFVFSLLIKSIMVEQQQSSII